jgi:predicted nucleotidyltransferase
LQRNDDFESDRSDVDVLVEYLPGRHPGLNHFRHQEELSELLRQRVDFNTPPMLSTQIREEIMREAVALFEQA